MVFEDNDLEGFFYKRNGWQRNKAHQQAAKHNLGGAATEIALVIKQLSGNKNAALVDYRSQINKPFLSLPGQGNNKRCTLAFYRFHVYLSFVGLYNVVT